MENKQIISINQLLLTKKLNIPDYQRPYKWNVKNISDLLEDIDTAISDAEKYKGFKYRIGTIIIHEDNDTEQLNIVDGQQRVISLALLGIFLGIISEENCSVLKVNFNNKTSKSNIYYNYMFIKDWFSLKNKDYKEKICNAMEDILEVVVLTVTELTEAFQLFDSQNTRGKALYPHDLLKAYHLRAMKDNPHEMRHAVQKWEAVNADEIKKLFEDYLFPISNWSKNLKTRTFTVKEIDSYKGISENTNYTYAKRAKKSMPYFQLTEPFVEGKDYFEMVEHYLKMLNEIIEEINNNPNFSKIKELLKKDKGAGYSYTKNLFWCSLLCYYDKFHNFEEKAVKKLFIWAFMLRVDMERLGYDSINNYAIENKEGVYSNCIPMFFLIAQSRLHSEIENIQINMDIEPNKIQRMKDDWKQLYDILKEGI